MGNNVGNNIDNNIDNNEKNNSKQIILLVIGIAILSVAVVGVSFAFFSYSKTGTTNNTITPGEIGLYLSEGASITLTNQFPMKNNEAISGISGQNGDVSSMTFTITGYSSGNATIPYTVYIDVPNDAPTGKTRFDNSEINVFLSNYSSKIGANNSGQTITVNANADTNSSAQGYIGPRPVSTLLASPYNAVLATGTIKAGTTSASPQVDTYTLNMYVNDTVRISDTNRTVTWLGETLPTKYCASDREFDSVNNKYISGCRLYYNNNELTVAANTDDEDDHTYLTTYSDLYYSIKLRVEGANG